MISTHESMLHACTQIDIHDITAYQQDMVKSSDAAAQPVVSAALLARSPAFASQAFDLLCT